MGKERKSRSGSISPDSESPNWGRVLVWLEGFHVSLFWYTVSTYRIEWLAALFDLGMMIFCALDFILFLIFVSDFC